MKAEHTPGPWTVIATPHKTAPGPYAVVSTADGYESTICWIDSNAGEFEDNAKVIAMAPEVLRALKQAADALGIGRTHNTLCAPSLAEWITDLLAQK